MVERSQLDALIDRFVALRGQGPYDRPTMMEAAMLAEEALSRPVPEDALDATGFGGAEQLKGYLAAERDR